VTAEATQSMTAGRKEKLEKVISTIQKRWGSQVIGRSSERLDVEVPCIASGFAELDRMVGIGGIPRGRISELMGAPTSGMTTTALRILAQAQAGDGTAVYIDPGRNFDPFYAQRNGVLLERLVLVHPLDPEQALAMLPDFVNNGGFELLICDLPAAIQHEEPAARKLSSILGRLLAPLSKHHTTLLFLTALSMGNIRSENMGVNGYPRQAALPHYTTLRLLFEREQWLYRQRDVHGFRTKVIVVKNKLSAPGKPVSITILIDGTREEGAA
jgi:recombination protein RecA